jgi:hypothetical protein
MEEKMSNRNTGNRNTGNRNTGNCNTGNCNTGNRNTGDRNTGDRNAGDWNTGDWNTGDRNAGDWNTGDCNTGYCNTGDCNTGNRNTGDRNTGNRNTGNCNTGGWNAGDWNAGDWNTGDWNTGYCNTITPKECLIFNKPAKRSEWKSADKPKWMFVNLTMWIPAVEMSNKEKEAYPSYVTTGGYLKCYPSLKAAYVEAWENASQEDRELTKGLPNFDAEVFEEIFGFNPFKKDKIIITIDGKEIEISQENYVSLKKQLTGDSK